LNARRGQGPFPGGQLLYGGRGFNLVKLFGREDGKSDDISGKGTHHATEDRRRVGVWGAFSGILLGLLGDSLPERDIKGKGRGSRRVVRRKSSLVNGSVGNFETGRGQVLSRSGFIL